MSNAIETKIVSVALPIVEVNPDVKLSLGKELLPDAPSYEDNSNIISYILMSYLNPLLKWGAKHDLQIEGNSIIYYY